MSTEQIVDIATKVVLLICLVVMQFLYWRALRITRDLLETCHQWQDQWTRMRDLAQSAMAAANFWRARYHTRHPEEFPDEPPGPTLQ